MYYAPYPYYGHLPMCNCQRQNIYQSMQNNPNHYWSRRNDDQWIQLRDHGKEPYVVNIEQTAEQNHTFRTAIWTGDHLQVTVMSIGIGEDIGLEVHPDTDQFLRIEEGHGFVQMGNSRNNLTFERSVREDDAIMVPAGTWHNVTNTGNQALKLYTIYAPPEHPFGTVHQTKAEAMAEEENY
ncbi:cupin domain-containing protein [Pseudogracilibacillus sp. SO30301A]|uniref:cupin domain-containing protein n=1 Tax=Pseudogracilibacillus sp. SO30301A TaxID=3098291 RepID=UPI00300DE109